MQEITKSKKRKRGAPEFKPTKAQRDDVRLYAAGGMAEPAIAAVIGICQNTLRKHFADDLEIGRAYEVAANLTRLRKAAKKGNVSAMKFLHAHFAAAAGAGKQGGGTKAPLGKKEVAAQEAEGAATGRFAPPAPPRSAGSGRLQ